MGVAVGVEVGVGEGVGVLVGSGVAVAVGVAGEDAGGITGALHEINKRNKSEQIALITAFSRFIMSLQHPS